MSVAKESHHGDGGGPLVDPATADATQRNFSEEEIRAVTWKCRLQKSYPEFIHDMLSRLPADCIKSMIQEFRNRAIEGAEKDTPAKVTILTSRDALVGDKLKAAQSFLRWGEEKYGQWTPVELELLKGDQMPYGRFAEYVNAHLPLRDSC